MGYMYKITKVTYKDATNGPQGDSKQFDTSPPLGSHVTTTCYKDAANGSPVIDTSYKDAANELHGNSIQVIVYAHRKWVE